MGLFATLFSSRPSPSDAARALAHEGARQSREKRLAVARQIREEIGLPPHGALQ